MINEALQDIITDYGIDTIMYNAMETGDMADPVIVALSTINLIDKPLICKFKAKCNETSEYYRIEGNKAFKDKKYQEAFMLYNKAILHAPTGSQSMVLAYSNRSALLLKMNANTFCLKDIETCLNMDCSPTLQEKLHQRKQCALNSTKTEKDLESLIHPSKLVLDDFFKFKTGSNFQLSSISNDIDFKAELPKKVIAKNNIKVGSILALDTAFITVVNDKNAYISCHYCSKLSLNLMPCDECCSFLFCSKECKTLCWEEYHSVECKIENLYNEVFHKDILRLPLKAALKMKALCKSWKEMEMASKKMGRERIAESSIEEIYGGANVFNLLNCKDDKPFVYGKMYHSSFFCAITIHHLMEIPGFFPPSTDKQSAAIKAFSRILMFMTLFTPTTMLITGTSCLKSWNKNLHIHTNYGWFPLVSKLRHACQPNTLALSLNNKVALVALKPIAPGTEITISYNGYILDNMIDGDMRKTQLWMLYGIACSCLICNKKWKNIHQNNTPLYHKQFMLELSCELRMKQIDLHTWEKQMPPECYTIFSKALGRFNDNYYSSEYHKIYKAFRGCLMSIQASVTRNVILDSNCNEFSFI